MIKWFKSYLSQRIQTVKIGNSLSHSSKLDTGVPQGSVLGPLLFTMYMSPLGELLRRHSVKFHFYADDTQIYLSFSNDHYHTPKKNIEACLRDVKDWMSLNFLLLNDSKTEVLVFSSGMVPNNFGALQVGNDFINVSFHAKNLGVILDSNLSMHDHITSICKSAYCHLRGISRIRKFLSQSDTENLVHAFVSSRIDSCNSLLAGLPTTKLNPLIRVQKAAARLITKSKKYDHITNIFIQLHWLPITQRIHYKIAILTFKALHALAPSYLCNLIAWYVPTRNLRSSNRFLAKQKSTKQSYSLGRKSKLLYKDRAFENIGPKLFNSLPLHVRSSQSLNVFKSSLKTHLFSLAFGN